MFYKYLLYDNMYKNILFYTKINQSRADMVNIAEIIFLNIVIWQEYFFKIFYAPAHILIFNIYGQLFRIL